MDTDEGNPGQVIVDYSITWGHIVKRMEQRFGISPRSEEKFSMHEIDVYVEKIWDEWAEQVHDQEERAKRRNNT